MWPYSGRCNKPSQPPAWVAHERCGRSQPLALSGWWAVRPVPDQYALVTDEQTNEQTQHRHRVKFSPLRPVADKYFTCVCPDCQRWTAFADTQVPQSQDSAATTIANCKIVCESSTQCTGFDWDSYRRQGSQCFLTGPGSNLRKRGRRLPGVTHYDLDRICQDRGNIHLYSS